MNARKEPEKAMGIERRLLSISEAAVYLGLGKNVAHNYLESIGAKVKIGRRSLYDKEVIDNALSSGKNTGTKKEDFYGKHQDN